MKTPPVFLAKPASPYLYLPMNRLNPRAGFKTHSFLAMVLTNLAVFNLSLAQSIRCEADEFLSGNLSPASKVSNFPMELRSDKALPVVVHVVWNKPEENISDSEIRQQIDRLNLEFNNSYTSRKSVPAEFRDRIGNPSIRFCLAGMDPDGKVSTGILRTQTPFAGIGSLRDGAGRYVIHYDPAGGSSGWDNNRYINIWIGTMEGAYGRSTIGGTAFTPAEDGIVIDPARWGTDFGRNLLGRTLVHEMGHYLGLRHTWGTSIGDCTEEDGIADTPVQDGPYFGCPDYPQRSCGNNNMFMNFMDFTDDYCLDMFTVDQVKRMQSVLSTFRPGLMTSPAACTFKIIPVNLSSLQLYYRALNGALVVRAEKIPDVPVDLVISNGLGQRVYRGRIEIIDHAEIPVKNWPAGIYFINLRYNKEMRTIKFFKP